MSVPVPPSPTVPPTPPTTPIADGAAKFGAAPIGAFLTMAVVTIAGIVTYVLTATATVVAMCDDHVMHPGQGCESRKNGVVVGVEGYPDVLARAENANMVGQGIGIALIVIGVVFAVLVYVRWMQDRQLKAELREDHGPALSSHGRTASSSLFGIAVGAGLVGFAGYLLLMGISKDEWPYFIGTVLAAAVGVLLLYTAIPKNGQLVEVYEAGVRVASRGKVTELPWSEVSYKIVPGKGTASHFISGPGVSSIALGAISDSERLQEVAQRRSVRARYAPTMEAINRGETVSFGQLGVSREGISSGRKMLPWAAYGGIMLAQGQITIAQIGKGRFVTLSLGQVENYTLLVHVIDAVAKQAPRS